MEKVKNALYEYIEILNKDEQDMTAEDYQTIYSIENDSNLIDVVKDIHSTHSTEDRYMIVNEFIKETEKKQKTEDEIMKEILQKEYGIDLTNIDHMKLQSGIDIIAFYDTKLNRKRLIDYSYAKSLTEEFTKIQNKNGLFQTDNDENNSLLIAKQEASKNTNKELDMIDINKAKSDYSDLVMRIKNQDPKKVQSINELLKAAEKRNIKFINFENMVALDEKGNIIESFYNEKTNQYELETPESINSSVDTVTNEEKIKQDYTQIDNSNIEENNSESNDIENNPTDFEMEEEIKDAEFLNELEESINIYHINCTKEEAMKNIIKYSNDLSMLENDYNTNQITQDEYEFYKICTERYDNIRKQKLDNGKAKTLTYEKGVISAIVISIIAIVISIIIFILTL